MAKACVKVEPLWLVLKKINLMYMAKMQKQKSNFGKESWNQRLFLVPTHTSLCTQEGSKHIEALSF